MVNVRLISVVLDAGLDIHPGGGAAKEICAEKQTRIRKSALQGVFIRIDFKMMIVFLNTGHFRMSKKSCFYSHRPSDLRVNIQS